MACTDDLCDDAARTCLHVIRDADSDGYADGSCGGDDCDDTDPAINPGEGERCNGGRDDDCDGLTDCSDLDCGADPVCESCAPERCTNGLDDDCDMMADCADSDCRTHPTCCLASETGCTDAVDEDCDGMVDCLDPDCAAAPTCCVAGEEVCNGLDDDCDGVVDDGVGCYFLDGVPLNALRTDECGASWYAYGEPDIASANTRPDVRRPDDVVVVIHEGPGGCGTSVAIIADATNDGEGGLLAASFTIAPPSAGGVLVSDDPRECRYSGASGTGSCDWRWQPCCTDGVLLGPFDSDFCVTTALSRPNGVLGVVALDGDEGTRRLAFGVPFELCGQLQPAVP